MISGAPSGAVSDRRQTALRLATNLCSSPRPIFISYPSAGDASVTLSCFNFQAPCPVSFRSSTIRSQLSRQNLSVAPTLPLNTVTQYSTNLLVRRLPFAKPTNDFHNARAGIHEARQQSSGNATGSPRCPLGQIEQEKFRTKAKPLARSCKSTKAICNCSGDGCALRVQQNCAGGFGRQPAYPQNQERGQIANQHPRLRFANGLEELLIHPGSSSSNLNR